MRHPRGPVCWRVLQGEASRVLATLPARSAQCCVTSPPYWGLRDYQDPEQLGMERTPEEFVARLVAILREAWRVLRDDGTLWLNLGDTYASGNGGPHLPLGGTAGLHAREGRGSHSPSTSGKQAYRVSAKGFKQPNRLPIPGIKPKDLVGVPWMAAFALRQDGWFLRSDNVWHKLNPLPESVRDRPGRAHEYVFLLSKSASYRYDADAVREPHQDRAGGPERFGQRGQANEARKAGDPAARTRMVSRTPPAEGYDPRGRNLRSVWPIPSQRFSGPHFSTFPEAIPRRCVLAGTRPGDLVLDPFCGAGTTGLVAAKLGRAFLGIELVAASAEMARERIRHGGAALLVPEAR